MKRFLATGTLVVLAAPGVIGQSEPLVTRVDFIASVTELDSAMSKLLKLPAYQSSLESDGDLSRNEMIAELNRMLDHYRPAFRVTPRPYREYPNVFDQYNPEGETRTIIRKLNRWGVIAPVGPIVTNAGPGLTAHEVGDGLGYFYSQISYLSHQPDPRWTPALSAE